jgi:V8-like Glu-specific endopeptidase
MMGPPGVEQLEALATRLRNTRAFDDLYTLTSEMAANGMGTEWTRRLEIQALIELGAYEMALGLVRRMLANPESEATIPEAHGHLGRIYKQMYVDARKGRTKEEPETLRLYLERAYTSYAAVWNTQKTHWHGVSALAIAVLQQRAGFARPDDATKALAEAVLASARAATEDKWSLASQGEALLALGDYTGAAEAYSRFAGQKSIDPFSLASPLRQLEEVWEISGEDPVKGKAVRVLKAALLAKSNEMGAENKGASTPASEMPALDVTFSRREMQLAEQELSPDPAPATPGAAGVVTRNLQKAFGDNFPLGGVAMAKLFRQASAVCRIHAMRDGVMKGVASGFAIKGDLLHASFGSGPVIVTNNHVISSRGAYGAKRFELCRASFVGEDMVTEHMVEFDAVLWESDVEAHDITILSPKGALPAGAQPLASIMPVGLGPRGMGDVGIGRCYVVGFPNAGDLAFSMADNVLLDHEAPANCVVTADASGRVTCAGAPASPVRIHYKTPTLGGNSGSPVFDADHIALLGVHRSGAPDLPRLPPNTGAYAANEGVWIESIRQAIAESVTAGAEASTLGAGLYYGIPSLTRASQPATVTPSSELTNAALPAAARDQGAAAPAAGELAGWPGDPNPGVSPVAQEILYRPGLAAEADVKAAQLESVIGVDNRTRIFDTGMTPWRMICAIRARWGSSIMLGTGCFIGPRTVLTAGHVVLPRKPGTRPESIEVIPGLSGEKRPYESFFAQRISVHPYWNGPFLPRFDVAVIHLDQDVGQRVGWFGLGARQRDQLVGCWAHITGYPGEMKETAAPGAIPLQACQLWHHAAPVERIENERIFYKADTTEGQSGAPIYVLADAQKISTPVVIGVHAYGARSTPGAVGAANSGAWIDGEMLKLIASWRAL